MICLLVFGFAMLGAATGICLSRAFPRRRHASRQTQERVRRRAVAERIARSHDPNARAAGLAWLDELDRQANR